MIHNRLYYLEETRGWLCPKQACFRTSRSCEVLILRFTQTTSEGYQVTKPKRKIMTLLDLLLKAVDKGLPQT